MKFEKCLHCPAIREHRCSGPNFMAMSSKELVEWATAYQRLHGITSAQLAEKSGVPKGTIDGLRYRADVRHDTVYPMMQALIELTGGTWDDELCADQNADCEKEKQELAMRLEYAQKIIDEKEKQIEQYRHALKASELSVKFNRVVRSILGVLCLVLGVYLALYLRFDFRYRNIGMIQETVSPLLYVLAAAIASCVTLLAVHLVRRKSKAK